MNWNAYRQLGDGIAAEFRRANDDERRLPGIAAKALRTAELPEIDFGSIATFLCETDVVQEPSNRFSDLPLVVYRSRDFYIQLLVWNESTTTIHQHAFSGAFRVLQGSSIHSRYRFSERRAIGSRLLVGDVRLDGVECLEAGDVCEIQPGRDGLMHALYHLDHPSATIVVRTPRLPWATPQYSISRPCFAVDEPALRNDPYVSILRRTLRAAWAADPSTVADVLYAQLPALDFPRLFLLCDELDTVLPDPADQARFFDAVSVRHGELAERLVESLEWRRIEQSLLQARSLTNDAELRFFVALLLNVPDRESLFRLVKERFPGSDPAKRCAESISRLTSPETLLDALTRKGALRKNGKRSEGLVQRLTGMLPKASDARTSVLNEVLAGTSNGEGGDVAAQLRRVPELSPLFDRQTRHRGPAHFGTEKRRIDRRAEGF